MDRALLIIFRDEKFERVIRIPSRSLGESPVSYRFPLCHDLSHKTD